MTPDLLHRIVRLAASYEAMDSLLFTITTDDGYWAGEGNQEGTLTAGVNCNDLFYWACADMEPIESDADVASLAACLAIDDAWGPSLYACRRRGMRPQNPVLKDIPPEIVSYFEACGPVRTNAECG